MLSLLTRVERIETATSQPQSKDDKGRKGDGVHRDSQQPARREKTNNATFPGMCFSAYCHGACKFSLSADCGTVCLKSTHGSWGLPRTTMTFWLCFRLSSLAALACKHPHQPWPGRHDQ